MRREGGEKEGTRRRGGHGGRPKNHQKIPKNPPEPGRRWGGRGKAWQSGEPPEQEGGAPRRVEEAARGGTGHPPVQLFFLPTPNGTFGNMRKHQRRGKGNGGENF